MTTIHRTATTAAVVLSLVAAGAPAASARPADYVSASQQAPVSVYSRPDNSMIAARSPSSAAIVAKPSVPQAVVPIQPSGFDWGDAGIGAAGGLVLAMLGVGGGLVIAHQRPRRPRHTTTLPN